MGERGEEEKRGNEGWGKEGSSAGGPGGKGSNSILALAEGKQDPEPTSLSKDMQREGGVHEEGPAEPALVRVQQTTRKNTGPGLQPCLPASPFNSIPAHTYPGSSGPSQETGSTFWPPGRQGKRHVLSESLCKHARSWRLGYVV